MKAQAAEALAKADGEARKRLDTYLTDWANYEGECAKPTPAEVQIKCGARYTLLERTQAAVQADVTKFQILPPGETVPKPDRPGPVAPK